MENTKQKRTFKESVKATGSKVKESVKATGAKAKSYAKKQAEKVKTYGRNYKNDLTSAYDIGYKRGWDDAYEIPNRFWAKSRAAAGYKKGVTNRKRSDKYIAQYNKRGN